MAENAKPLVLAQNVFELGTPSATDTATGYDVLNILDRRPYTWWQANAHGTKYITIDCGTPTACDCLGVVGHNFYTCGATVSVECSADNFAAETIVALAGFTVLTNLAFLKIFTTQTKRYWRIKIVTAAIAAKIAVAFLGPGVSFPRTLSVDKNSDPGPEKIIAESTRSKTGNLIGSALAYVSRIITVTFDVITPAWITNTFRPLWDTYLSQLYPVFWAWEITNHPTEVYFVKIPDNFNLSMPYTSSNYRSITLQFEGVKE
jgi:hypothetical protein